MAEKIRIKEKISRRGDDGHKIVPVRLRDELIDLLLVSALDIVKVEE